MVWGFFVLGFFVVVVMGGVGVFVLLVVFWSFF